jgi:hypothetical protein
MDEEDILANFPREEECEAFRMKEAPQTHQKDYSMNYCHVWKGLGKVEMQ